MQGAVASAFRNHVHCQFHFRGAAREDITMKIIRARVRQIIGKGREKGISCPERVYIGTRSVLIRKIKTKNTSYNPPYMYSTECNADVAV